MSEIHTQIEQTEHRISELKEQIELRDRILRLTNNSDFRFVIQDMFLNKEAARFVQLSEDPSLPPESQKDSLRIAQSTGHLKRWLSMNIRMGNMAEEDLVNQHEIIEQLRAEGASE